MFLTPQQYFRLHEGRPRKRFGQHFLAQQGTAERIVRSANLKESDVTVEVGPGLGALTQFIIPQVRRLHLVELDRDLADYLEKSIPDSECQVSIHRQDIMTFDFHSVAESLEGSGEPQRLVVLGNLPYNISSPLVFHLLESRSVIERAVFMVQKEVGERLAAGPGSKDYGVLSVLLGIYAHVVPLFTVGPSQFFPPPKVDSLVLRLTFDSEPPESAPPFGFVRKVVNAAFQQRRKTLHNSLKALFGHDVEALDAGFEQSGIEPKRRPESLSPEEFLKLSESLYAGFSAKRGDADE